jgi:hypothetical protein
MMSTPLYGKLFNPFDWPDTIEKLERNILDVERNSGWQTYTDWNRKNRDFSEQVIYTERALIADLLEAAFSFSNPHQTQGQVYLLKSPYVTTAFLYFPRFIVKFQMVSGQMEDGANEADVFFDNRATDGSTPTKALLVADTDAATGKPARIIKGLTETKVDPEHFGWERLRTPQIRYLLVVRYGDGGSRRQDRLLIDMKKFTKAAGTIDLAIVNYEYPIAATSGMWRMKGSVGTRMNQVPLLFRPYDSGNLPLLFSHQQDVQSPMSKRDDARYAAIVQPHLSVWLALIDDYLKSGPVGDGEAHQFLTSLKKEMGDSLRKLDYSLSEPITYANLNLISPKAAGVAAFHVENATDVSVVLVKPRTCC